MRRVTKILVTTISVGLAGLTLSESGAARVALREITISVPGIPGPYCVYGIEKRLREMPEVVGVRLLWEKDELRVSLKDGATMTREEIERVMEGAEYPYEYSVER